MGEHSTMSAGAALTGGALDMSLDEMIAKGAKPNSRTPTELAKNHGTNRVQNKEKKEFKSAPHHPGPRRYMAYSADHFGANSFFRRNAAFAQRRRTPWDVIEGNLFTCSAATDYGRKANGRGGYAFRRAPVGERLIRVSGLEYSVLKEDLVELFTAVGPIQRCWIDFDRTSRSLGSGGVIFERPEDAKRAISIFNGKTLDGSVITLKLSKHLAEMEDDLFGGEADDFSSNRRPQRFITVNERTHFS